MEFEKGVREPTHALSPQNAVLTIIRWVFLLYGFIATIGRIPILCLSLPRTAATSAIVHGDGLLLHDHADRTPERCLCRLT